MLWIRFLLLLLQRPWQQQLLPEDVSYQTVRVMPWDCDLNIHLNNACYSSYLDLARIRWILEIGGGRLFIHSGWNMVLSKQTLTFLREIKPFAKVVISSKVEGFDDNYLNLKHELRIDGRVHAIASAQLVMLKQKRVHSFEHFVAELPHQP